MNFVEMAFMIHLFLVLGVSSLKLYNIFHKCEKVPLEWSVLTFIIMLFGYFIGFVTLISEKTFIYGIMFSFTSLFFILNFFFMIAELLFYLGVFTNKSVGKRNAIKEYKMS